MAGVHFLLGSTVDQLLILSLRGWTVMWQRLSGESYTQWLMLDHWNSFTRTTDHST